MSVPVWHLYPDAERLAERLAAAISRLAAEAIAARGAFHWVLAGGHTPRAVYDLLPRYAGQWQHWHLYYGDERCLSPSDDERNSQLVAKSALGSAPIPRAQHHIIPAEQGAEAAARAYTAILPLHRFDLVLLGMGEDGHCASLFPGQEAGFAPDAPAALAVHDSPKPPSDRVSLSAARLLQTRAMFFVVTGVAKAPAIEAWRAGADLPAARLGANADVWLDAAAWGR
ncbi:6-phosphogluconolactonase [Acidithiobacillus sp. AMEEHan]|uniref:6-phosphogluconolactonase n=1 Tax=Acidithiobacillus sp. AMEEHan TaxID=2994951 RepID=UPI0027E53667|nr:6-phosphogluconolactonase [Acidithiobacillus sp. AMEEHan]